MTVNLNIGPEDNFEKDSRSSKHILNLRNTDAAKKKSAHNEVSLNLKEEIKFRNKKASGRICIVGELPRNKQGLGRAPMILAALAMIFVLNFGQLIYRGTSQGETALALAADGLTSLKGASQSFISGEPGADSLLFGEAELLFTQAEKTASFLLNNSSPWLSEPSQVSSLRNILDAGELMAQVGQYISDTRVALSAIPEDGSLTDFIRNVSETSIEPAADKIDEINDLLDNVDLSGTGYEEEFSSYREKLTTLSDMLDIWLESKEPLLYALGDRYVQHYLVLLMNNDEMRGGGGFIGSVALLEVNDGRITDLNFHDVYDFDDHFFEQIDVPVHELEALTTNWRLRDSNTSPDFPTSAEQALWFWDKEGYQGVDGVIGINLSSAQALLEDVGGIKIPSLVKELTAETFPAVMSTLIEAKVFGSTSPKAVLGEFMDTFIASIQGTELKTKVALSILEEARKKQILFYHRNSSVENLLTSMGMDGSIPILGDLENDFVLTQFTNRGGNKTDRYMQTDLNHQTHIFADGGIVNSLTITRTHTFNAATLAWLKQTLADYNFYDWNSGLENVLGNEANESGVRIYLPEGVQILEVKGDAHRDDLQFYYDEQLDISYYYLDQVIFPDSSKQVSIIYSLPQTLEGEFQEYKFQLFQQPGLKSISFEKTVTAPDDIMLSSKPLATEQREETDYVLKGSLNGDMEMTLLYR